ncbi:MAG: hypothetical protein LBS47_00675 [Endomicrobium sp.]|nr:hypothetical protein [Endomicrobium sp.]
MKIFKKKEFGSIENFLEVNSKKIIFTQEEREINPTSLKEKLQKCPKTQISHTQAKNRKNINLYIILN